MKMRVVSATLLAVMALMLCFSASAAEAVRQGLQLCAGSVVPSLFPFLVLSSLFLSLGGADLLSPRLQQTAGWVLGCSGTGVSVFFLSLLGGYPTGPRLIGQLCRAGRLSPQEAEHLLLFCNNAGPAFILGLVGLGRFGSLRIGIYLYLIHAAAAAVIALLYRPRTPFTAPQEPRSPSPSFAEALVQSIGDAGSTMVQICSFVTFFYTALQLLTSLTHLPHPLLLGFAELTQGILTLPDGHRGFVMAAALLGWGGLSVHCQTAAVLSGTGLALRPHLRGKALQSAISAALAFFVWRWIT
ncbi:MAG: sporulation protein [Ruminococcaceae bacterium]|nr:sporulation protein [Oscillospiraceae bacterium]